MTDTSHHTTALLARFREGDPTALDALLGHTCDRLRHLAHRMLRTYPAVGRWEQTDDVLQNAQIRLCRALEAAPPQSARHYYNLAALQIRRELLDLADRHTGPNGDGANHHTDGAGGVLASAEDPAGEPSSVAGWCEFHRSVETLPDEEREVFGLLWYEGLSQAEAAAVLGASIRTVKRRWQSARLALARALGDTDPHDAGSS
jgi:RNA polymerase sigma factor (sigma-70 family)